jgi:hypothetical protein
VATFDDLTKAKGFWLYRDQDSSALGIPIPSTGPLADLFGLKSDYILEMFGRSDDGGSMLLASVAFPLPPESMNIRRPPATTVTHTLGYLPVREHSINRVLEIEFRGRSGVADRQGHDREGKLITAPGPELVQEFDALLDRYQRLCHDDAVWYRRPTSARTVRESTGLGGPYLVLRSFSHGLHVRVEPTDWSVRKDVASSRFSLMWQLSLRAYAPATPEKSPGLFMRVQDVMELASDFVRAGATAIGATRNAVSSMTSLASSARGPLQAVGSSMRQVTGLMRDVRGVADLPRQYMGDVNAILVAGAEAVDTWRTGAGSINPSAGIDSQLRRSERLLGQLEQASSSNATAVGALGGRIADARIQTGAYAITLSPTDANVGTTSDPPPPGASASSTGSDDAPAGVTVTLPQGSSLERLALRYYGSRELWMRIVQANRMQSATRHADGSTLTPGDRLLIPLSGRALAGARLGPTHNPQTDPYGTDVYLDASTGDLEINGDATDIRLVRDRGNLEQAIRCRVLTTQGASSPFPSYGLPEFVGTPTSPEQLGLLASHLSMQLERDVRVLDIDRLILVDEGDSLSAFASIRPVVGDALELVTPV